MMFPLQKKLCLKKLKTLEYYSSKKKYIYTVYIDFEAQIF